MRRGFAALHAMVTATLGRRILWRLQSCQWVGGVGSAAKREQRYCTPKLLLGYATKDVAKAAYEAEGAHEEHEERLGVQPTIEEEAD